MSNQKQNPSEQLNLASDETKIFKCVAHGENISKKLQSFYEKKEFFDIVLVAGIDNVKVQAHRIVLSASSDFFLAMVRSNLQEAKANEVDLKEIDGITIKLIVDFMYTGSIELRCETVESILRAADFLQMDTLKSACCDFMGEQLDTSNCLGISLFAEQHNYTALHKKASSFVCKHFDKVWIEKEFSQLNEEQLNKFLSSDDFMPHSEKTVFQSLVAWVEHDKENREKCIFSLLSHVRFTLLKPKFIIENRHSVCKTIECYELICSWLQWHLSPESRFQFPKEHTKARKAIQKIAFANIESYNLKVQTYNADLNTWSYEDLPTSPIRKTQYSWIVINKKLIIVGGKISRDLTNSVECLDLQTKKWTDMPPMAFGRREPALTEFNGDLYVVGGVTDRGWSCSVEKYNFSTREWQNVASLNSRFEYIKVAVVDGYLYAVGNNCHFMDCYDLGTNKWTQKAFNNGQLSFFGFAAGHGHLYTVGGKVNETVTKSVERYNPSTETWEVVSPLKEARCAISCVDMNNRFLACGGSISRNSANLVEEYDYETNKWNTLASLLPRESEISSIFII